jgi:heme exporter protein C
MPPSAHAAPAAPPAGTAPGIFDWLFPVAVLALAGTLLRVAYFTPIEALQGPAQKIFYLHLPSVLVAYIAFGLMALSSVLYLWLRDARLDRMAAINAEVGLVFLSVTLTTGPIWGRTVWGTWWTWDARLTLALFLWLLVLGYLVLRGAVDDAELRARYSAVVAILAALLIPFIHLSVYLFRTLHPRPIVLKPSAPSLPPEMLITLLIAFGAVLLFYIALARARYRLATARDLAEDAAEASGR